MQISRPERIPTSLSFWPTNPREQPGPCSSETLTKTATVHRRALNLSVKTDAPANLDASGLYGASIENLPVFDQDILTTMSRFLDASAIGTNGATLVVNGVEVNNQNVSALAIPQIKINQDPILLSTNGQDTVAFETGIPGVSRHG